MSGKSVTCSNQYRLRFFNPTLCLPLEEQVIDVAGSEPALTAFKIIKGLIILFPGIARPAPSVGDPTYREIDIRRQPWPTVAHAETTAATNIGSTR